MVASGATIDFLILHHCKSGTVPDVQGQLEPMYAVFSKLTKFSLKCHPIHPGTHKDPSIGTQT